MEPNLKGQLIDQQISFKFNPPSAPHYGGLWEWEGKSVKAALQVVLGSQTVTETVLQTVLIEMEGVLNSKLLGYLPSAAADPDPITPTTFLIGWCDASLPQAMFADSGVVGRRRWHCSQLITDHFWANFSVITNPTYSHVGNGGLRQEIWTSDRWYW